MLKKRKTTAAKLSALIACAALLLPGASVSAQDGAAEDTAGGGSEISEQAGSDLSLTPVAEDSKLSGDVSFNRIGPSGEGTVVYELRANMQFSPVPAQEAGGEPASYERDTISFARDRFDVPVQSVENTTVNGVPLPDEQVALFEFPNSTRQDSALPAGLDGDLVSLDTRGLELDQTFPVTMRVHMPEDTPEDSAFQWALYEGELPEETRSTSTREPVPNDHSRVIVQVAGDRLLSGTNNASRVTGPLGPRLERVFQNTPGQGAVLRLYAPLNQKAFGQTEAATAWEQGAAGENAQPINEPWATCTADANGECVFEIPRASGPGTYDYFWVVMENASPGYQVQDWVRLGVSGDTDTGRARVLRNAFATPLLKPGETYYSGVEYRRAGTSREGNGADWGTSDSSAFMYEEPSRQIQGSLGGFVPYRSSLGSFIQVRENQTMPEGCGLKAALVVDTSGSMGRSMNVVREVVGSAIDGLSTTSTQIGLYSFSTTSPGTGEGGISPMPQNLDPQPVYTEAGREALKNWQETLKVHGGYLSGNDRSGGSTNWEDGLKQVADYNAAHPTDPYDVIYFITDGNPTVYNNPSGQPNSGNSGAESEMRDLEAAVLMANTVKAQGTRVIAVGIPSNWPTSWISPIPKDRVANLEISEVNLRAISGGQGGVDEKTLRSSDFAFFTDQDVFKQALINSLNIPCQVTVERRFYEGDEKDVIPTPANTRGTKAESTDGLWEFNGELKPQLGETVTESKVPSAENSQKDNNIAEFPLEVKGPYPEIKITEPASKIPDGWVRMDAGAGGERAYCTDKRGNPVSATSLGSELTNDFKLTDVPGTGGIHCVVYYRSKSEKPVFNLTLNKVNAADQSQNLDGAQFQLRRLDNGDPAVIGPAPDEGRPASQFTWSNLQFGRYELIETRAADGGYSLLPRPVYFRVEQSGGATKLFMLSDADDKIGTEVTDPTSSANFPVVQFSTLETSGTAEVAMKLANIRSGELPASGGRGIHVPLFLGLLLLLTGVLAGRRRAVGGGW